MERIDIIEVIGKKYLQSNIENGEFSYQKALNRPIKGHKFLDLRFFHGTISVLIETKQKFTEKDEKQLFDYIKLEKELTKNNVVGILANTKNDKIKVWKNAEFLENETKLRTFDEYIDFFNVEKINDKEKVMLSTYKLNELLHRNDIDEGIRSQFVGTCLLALKNDCSYKGLSTKQIITGIEDIYYIGAKKNDNGVMKKVEYNEDLITKGNCIIFICDGQGSVGYTNYIDQDFIGSTTLTVGHNEFLNPYVGAFLVTVLDMERPKYSYGRKYSSSLSKAEILLPAKNGKPDWQYMEDYIKSLPYSDLI